MNSDARANGRPYAIADFRDESKYPARPTLKRWRWEFLRRNAEYQAFFDLHGVGGYVPGCERFGMMQLLNPRDDLDPANEQTSAATTLAPGMGLVLSHENRAGPRVEIPDAQRREGARPER